jgi:hypothetical protein
MRQQRQLATQLALSLPPARQGEPTSPFVCRFHTDSLSLSLSLGSLPHDLLPDQPLQLLLTQLLLIAIELEELLRNRVSRRLVLRVMVRLEVGVLEGFVDGDALDGVEGQELLEEVERKVGRLGEEGFERDLLLEGEGADVFAGAA